MKVVRVLSLICFAFVFAAQANATTHPCFPEGDGPQTFRDAIDEATTIVLARAENATKGLFARKDLYQINFEVVETIKGEQDRPFKQTGTIIHGVDKDDHGDFAGHTRMTFWDRLETRTSSSQNCTGELGFEPQATYLIFDPGRNRGNAPLNIGYEKVDGADYDLWLDAVRKMVADPALSASRAMSAADYLKEQQSVVLILVESCSERLRSSAHFIADVAEPLVGEAITRDHLDPEIFSQALKGCNGLTTLLGIFYPPDPQAFQTYDVNRLPQQVFIPIVDGAVDLSQLRTEIEFTGAQQMTLEELVAVIHTPRP